MSEIPRRVFTKGWDTLKHQIARPFKDSLGLGSRYPTYRQLDRREFLKQAGAITGTAVMVGTVLYQVGRAQYDAYSKPEGLPEDILTKEELAKAGITVYQTPDVQLYIRREALEIPVFKDAAKKRIDGLTISLVDHDRISWNAVNKLPYEARKAWQDVNPHPKQWKEPYWDNLVKYFKDKRDWYGKTKELTSEILGLDEELFNIDMRKIELLIGAGADLEEAMRLQREREELAVKLRLLRSQQIESALIGEHKLNELLDVAVGPRDKAIEYFAENGRDDSYVTGQILKPNKSFRRKAFIYVCVGKDQKPSPDQSLPNPDWFVIEGENGPVYLGENNSGFTLRHEIGHYEGKRQESDNEKEREDEADELAYVGIAKAWKQYQETGDTSGYPFVFVTDEGITITKNIATSNTQDTRLA